MVVTGAAQASQGPNATNKAAFIRTGTAYLLADMMSSLDRERPQCPTLYFNALLHSHNGGMVMPPSHLAEFLRESTDVNPQLLLKVLHCSFSNFDRRDWDQWRQVVPLAADALIQSLKTAEALPQFTPAATQGGHIRPPSRTVHGGDAGVNAAIANNEQAMAVDRPKPPPQLLALAVGMAKSKLLMLEMPKRPVKVTVVVELQVNERRDDRNLLRAASETVHGTSLLSSLVHDLEWLSQPVHGHGTSSYQQKEPLIQWRLVLADTDSSAAPTCSCADVARTAINTQVESVDHMNRIEIVECANILEAIQGSEDGSAAAGDMSSMGASSTLNEKKNPAAESDVVVLFQNPAFCEQATQMGHIVHNLLMNDSSHGGAGAKSYTGTGKKGDVGPPLALLGENPLVDQNPVNVVVKTMMQALLGVETGPYRLAPGVCGFKTKYFLGMKKQWSAVLEHRRRIIYGINGNGGGSGTGQDEATLGEPDQKEKKSAKKEKKPNTEQLEKEKAEAAAQQAATAALDKLKMSEDHGDLTFPNAPLARCMFFVASSSLYVSAIQNAKGGSSTSAVPRMSESLLELKNAVQIVKGTIRPVELSGTLTTWDVIAVEEVLTSFELMASLTHTFNLLPKRNYSPNAAGGTLMASPPPPREGDQTQAESGGAEGEALPAGSLERRWEEAFYSTSMNKDVWDHLLYDCTQLFPVTLFANTETNVVTKTAATLSPETITEVFTILKTEQTQPGGDGGGGM